MSDDDQGVIVGGRDVSDEDMIVEEWSTESGAEGSRRGRRPHRR